MGSQGKYFVNMKPVMEKLEKLIKEEPLIAQTALRVVARHVKEAARELVPVDTGDLLYGIRYSVSPARNEAKVFASSKKGGANHEYATIVHEDLEQFHSHGEAKFIERPIKETAASGIMLKAIHQLIVKNFTRNYGFMPLVDNDQDFENWQTTSTPAPVSKSAWVEGWYQKTAAKR